jgi:hypothetical protein
MDEATQIADELLKDKTINRFHQKQKKVNVKKTYATKKKGEFEEWKCICD